MATTRTKKPVATPDDFEEGLTLMRMRTENIKLVRYIDISLNEPLTLIGGENDNGKTSYLDSYAWCVLGKLEIQMDPIRHGQQTGRIACDFGDGEKVKMSVTRTLKRVGDSEWTDSVDVEIPGYITPTRIEEFLRKLSGDFVDPMSFDRMKPVEKFEALQKLVVGFDFKAYDKTREGKYDARTEVGRDQRKEQSAADAIVFSADPPCERVDEAAIQQELADAGNTNADIERRRGNREKANDAIAAARLVISQTDGAIEIARQKAEATRDRDINHLEQQIAELQRRIAEVRAVCEDEIVRERTRLRAEQTNAEMRISELQAKLDADGDLPESKDVAEISTRLTNARVANKRLDDWETLRKRHNDHKAEADRLAKKYDELSAEISTLDASKQKAIEEAQLPVDGIGFADGYISLPAGDGSGPVPWEQAGTAVRTDASLALAMAMQPKLKVILIRDGSLIGKTIRERIRQRAAENGYRVLMEVVEDGKGTHVVIENGEVKARGNDARGGEQQQTGALL